MKKTKKKKYSIRLSFLIAAFVFMTCGQLTPFCSAQSSRTAIDKSLVPAVGENVSQFAPPGWKVEAQVKGDLNGDSLLDFAVTLIEDKPAKNKDGKPVQRYRALVVLLQNKDGKLSRAGLADELLVCTQCAGHSDDDAQTSVRIYKGRLVVSQENDGDEGTTIHNFRYERETQRFRLISYDFNGYGPRPSSRNNYLTGLLTITRKGRKRKVERIQLTIEKIYLEEVHRGQVPV
jgi:hypothetical protein